MKRVLMSLMILSVLGLACGPVAAVVVPGAELHLNANIAASWYGGPILTVGGNPDMASLPDSDTWWNLNVMGAYGHIVGDITNPDGSNVPESRPGMYLGTNGFSLDFNTRRSWNPWWVQGTGEPGSPSYFEGAYAGYADAGTEAWMRKTPNRTSDLTWEIWFRPATNTCFKAFNSGGNNSPYIMTNEVYAQGRGFSFFETRTATSAKLYWRAMTGNFTESTITYDLPDTTSWYHAVGIFTAEAVQKLYINGQLVQELNVGAWGNGTANIPLSLFCRNDAVRHSDADISIARIYHTALTPDQIVQNYNNDAALFGAAAVVMPTVSGTVAPEGYAGDKNALYVEFQLQPVGGGDNITRAVLLDSAGAFALRSIPRGSYNITVQTPFCLRQVLSDVEVYDDPTVLDPIELKAADSNGDNRVSFEDFSILQNNYGQRGAPAANPLAAATATGGCAPTGLVLMALLGWAVLPLRFRSDD